MSDDEIRELIARFPAKASTTMTLHTLADEALARGAAFRTAEYDRNELDVLRVEAAELRKCVAQLETALRWYAATKHWACDAHSGYCDADLDRGEKARAVLTAGKPASET